ncbi:RagB/SusD family nutrient uptake outer membrane protein [Danxiaibacter flavus]|uniref:RagB/SusD family nutrient uptake outer membrane protein n=1 Tax=Danxiaibacter flavus TaxID=3049108 RepID=A0ABV3Z921_9BACT|nr:RagB/SusD family nutrient uptake outer membrane protein [Chitinophagaceae bacterium DXS]
MKKYITIITTFVLLSSCKKDFLDRYPQTIISPQLYFNTESDLSLYINGLLDHPGSSLFVNGNEQATDDYATTGNVTMKNLMGGNVSSQNTPNNWTWGRLRSINYFLDNYAKANVPENTKNHYAGLARYYRAKFYLDKVKNYSDVPWYSYTINPSDSAQLYKASDPRTAVVDSIFADLDFAANNVMEKVPAGTPGLWAVKAMYARMALFEGTYRKYHAELNLQSTAARFLQMAQKQAGDIMASGKFTLTANYADLFNTADLSGNKEVILNTAYDVAKGVSSSGNFGLLDYEQSPSKDLVQTYLMKDGTRYTDIPNYQKKQFVEEFQNRDLRLYATYIYPGLAVIPGTKPYVQKLNNNFTGYHQLKGFNNNSTDGTIVSSVDVAAIRYAEVLLTYAEASAELGTVTQADIDQTIGLLRTRAGMPALNMAAANASPDAVLAAKYPDVSGANKGLILEIRREKRVEFALEGQRYNDLLRWNAGATCFAPYAQGLYFPGLGQYDLTGDGIADIILIKKSDAIPAEADKLQNSLGQTLIYYKAGSFGDQGVTVYLQNGENGGAIVTGLAPRNFVAPKYYYLPIPVLEITQNPKLKQPFGWE